MFPSASRDKLYRVALGALIGAWNVNPCKDTSPSKSLASKSATMSLYPVFNQNASANV
jgi:hypothetical protein